MGMKGVICEVLYNEQKKIIKSLENQLKGKNEIIIKETKRANEMFQLSYNRKLKIQELQAEINQLREALENMTKSFDNLKAYYPQTFLFAEDCKRRINQALTGESEE